MSEFVFFSNNKNKIKEISKLFKDTSFTILNLNNFEKIKSPYEIGLTFEENAKIKSIFGLNKFNIDCFADDSGICIEAMNGGPGVLSKKFLGLVKDKNKKLNEIINICQKKNSFYAFFQTTICLSLRKKKIIFFTGKIEGRISKIIVGDSGFGYDPIFIPKGHKKTFAEMKIDEKNKISHRSLAVKKLKEYLVSI